MNRRRYGGQFAQVLVAALLTLPASAAASNTYVNAETGNNANDPCTSPSLPCATIAEGLNDAGAGDTVFVQAPTAPPVTYVESVSVDNGKSLVAESTNPANTIIDNGSPASGASVTLSGSSAVLVEGFTIASDRLPMHSIVSAGATATIQDNVFDEPTVPAEFGNGDVLVEGSGSPMFVDNEFKDTNPTDAQRAILLRAGGGPVTVSGNSFDGFQISIELDQNSTFAQPPVISDNLITGAHGGSGIRIEDSATVAHNTLRDAGSGAKGIDVFGAGLTATLRRNQIIGHQIGVDAGAPVMPSSMTLDGDLIAQSTLNGLRLFNGGTSLNVTATNVTVVDTTAAQADINVADNASLTLDSSIVGNGGIDDAGTGTCAISFSRGSGNGNCASGFTTTAAPMFVNPMTDPPDYHLMSSSPLIDAGNPAVPPPGTVDLDGDARSIDGNGDCTARRDMGADEVVAAANPACTPAPLAKDTDPPESKIDKGPKKRSHLSKVKIKFSSDEPGSTFQCRLDKQPFAPCTSPYKQRVQPGKHTFQVEAIDSAGNIDSSAAKLKFNVLP